MDGAGVESLNLEFLLAAGCIGLNAFFVAAEFAIVKVRGSRIQQLIESGNRRALVVSKMLEDLESYLAATQFGITVSSLCLGWLGEPAVAHAVRHFVQQVAPDSYWSSPVFIHSMAGLIAFALLTFLQIVLGELIPRAVGIRYAENVAIAVAPLIYSMRRLLAPVLFVFDRAARTVLGVFGIVGGRVSEKFSEEELRLVMVESVGRGTMTDAKLDLIDNVFDFSKKTAKQVMISRDAIISLSIQEPADKNLAKAKQNNHTRYPLCEGSIDQVMGLINIKDVLWESEESREHLDFRKIRREILFVPEDKPLTKLLKDFQRNKIHMAIVIDEFGLTVGLVTLEDVLEELVGEIQDEFDQEVSRIQLMRDGSYLIDGGTLVEEVEEKFGIHIEKHENTTIGGAILSQLGRLPRVGDTATFDAFTFIVKALKGRRISSIQAIKKAIRRIANEKQRA